MEGTPFIDDHKPLFHKQTGEQVVRLGIRVQCHLVEESDVERP
jgi:hypothetical protein